MNHVLRELEQASQEVFAEMEAPVYKSSSLIRELMDHDAVEQMVEAVLAVETDDKCSAKRKKPWPTAAPFRSS